MRRSMLIALLTCGIMMVAQSSVSAAEKKAKMDAPETGLKGAQGALVHRGSSESS